MKHSEVLAILRGEAPNAAHYLVLAFATEPGKTASDIGQGSGPYASALAAELVISSAMRFSGCAGAAPGKSNRTTAKMTRASIAMRGPRQDYGKALPNRTTLLRAHADEVSEVHMQNGNMHPPRFRIYEAILLAVAALLMALALLVPLGD